MIGLYLSYTLGPDMEEDSPGWLEAANLLVNSAKGVEREYSTVPVKFAGARFSEGGRELSLHLQGVRYAEHFNQTTVEQALMEAATELARVAGEPERVETENFSSSEATTNLEGLASGVPNLQLVSERP